MAGPWEKFQSSSEPAVSGPWSKFAATTSAGLPVNPAQSPNEDVPPTFSGPEFQGQSQPTQEGVNPLLEAARVADVSLKGAGAIPEFLANAYRGAEQVGRMGLEAVGAPTEIPLPEGTPESLRSILSVTPGQWVQRGIQRLFAPIEQPQTALGQAAGRIGKTAVSTFVGPGMLAAPKEMAKLAGAAGLGGEAGYQVAGETGQAIGSIGGGLTQAGLNAVTNAQTRLAGRALEGVSDYELQAANTLMNEARKLGVNLTLAQALPTRQNIAAMEEIFAREPAALGLVQQLRNQADEVASAARSGMGAIPGTQLTATEAAERSAGVQKEGIKALKRYRTEQTKPLYAAAGSVDPQVNRDFRKYLLMQAKQFPNTKEESLLRGLAKDLRTESVVDGKKVYTPITDVNDLNRVLQKVENKVKFTQTKGSSDRITGQRVSDAVKSLRAQLEELSPEFAEAQGRFRQISEQVINPVTKAAPGRVGKGEVLREGENAGLTNQTFAVFDAGTPKGVKSSDIQALYKNATRALRGKELQASGKRDWLNLGKTWVEGKLNATLQTEGGRLSPQTAKNLEKAFFGTDNQRRGFNDVMSTMAKASGANEKEVVDGMNTLIRTIQHAANRPGSVPGFSDADYTKAVKTLWGKVAGATVLMPLRTPMRAINDLIGDNAVQTVSDAMRTPEGIRLLKELATKQAGSPGAYSVLAAWRSGLSPVEQPQPEE